LASTLKFHLHPPAKKASSKKSRPGELLGVACLDLFAQGFDGRFERRRILEPSRAVGGDAVRAAPHDDFPGGENPPVFSSDARGSKSFPGFWISPIGNQSDLFREMVKTGVFSLGKGRV
jgi:hypothetical protein